MTLRYEDRCEAGRQLAEKLSTYRGRKDVVVLALPRGGVAVGAEVAKALDLPLDLMLVRKLGAPGDEEFAIGALATGGLRFINDQTVRLLNIPPQMLDAIVAREEKELDRRNDVYRKGELRPDVEGCTVILVDDGMATGADMHVAVQASRQWGAAHVVVAVPVSSDTALDLVAAEADEIVCLHAPPVFLGVGSFYRSFDQLDDDEVLRLIADAQR
jgi:predicted phosphoribosyltransferase